MVGLTDVIKVGIEDVTKLVVHSAPLLADALGSPVSGLVLNLLSNLFHVDAGNLGELVSKISNDPEAGLKLKTLEYEHAETLAKISASNYATEVNDRINARSYIEEYKGFLKGLAIMVTFGFFAVLIMMFIPLSISDAEKNLLSMLVGMLASKWQTIIDFFYGSSSTHHGEINK